MNITIQATNIYVFNKAPLQTLRTVWKRIAPWVVDSAGINEGGEVAKGLRRLGLYRLRFKEGDRHTQNNPILIRRGHKILWKRYYQANPGTGTKYTPPRNIFVVAYKKRGKTIVHINTHFHVVPEDRLAYMSEEEYNVTANQYKRQAEQVKELMKGYTRLGYIVFVTADGNTRRWPGKKDWKYAAYNYLEFDDFKVVQHGVDIIVYNSRKVSNVKTKIVAREVLGDADHDTIVLRGKIN